MSCLPPSGSPATALVVKQKRRWLCIVSSLQHDGVSFSGYVVLAHVIQAVSTRMPLHALLLKRVQLLRLGHLADVIRLVVSWIRNTTGWCLAAWAGSHPRSTCLSASRGGGFLAVLFSLTVSVRFENRPGVRLDLVAVTSTSSHPCS